MAHSEQNHSNDGPRVAAPGAGAAHEHHGIKRYVVIWLVLLGMTGLTWYTGQQHYGGHVNIMLAMLIACTKATLVVLFFMHLWDEGSINRLVFVLSVFFAILLMIGAFGDLVFRLDVALPPGMQR